MSVANYQPNQTCLSLYFYSKSTGIAFKLSKRQNTDQSTYIIIHVSQAFGSVSIKTVFYANKKIFMLLNRMHWVVLFLFVCVVCPNVVN